MADGGACREAGQGTSVAVALAGRLCRLSVDLLGADASWTLLEDRARDAFVPVASHGLGLDRPLAAPPAARGPVGVARQMIGDLLSRLAADGVTEDPSALVGADPGVRALYMGLRQPEGVVGVQVAVRRRRFAPGALRLARLIADVGSLGLANLALRSQLERAWHASTEYLANASHGLRTPLNVILGYAEMARDPVIDDEEQGHYLDMIARYAGVLAGAVDALCRASHVLLPPHADAGRPANGNGNGGGTWAATVAAPDPGLRTGAGGPTESGVLELPLGAFRATTKGARRGYPDGVGTGVTAALVGTLPRRPG